MEGVRFDENTKAGHDHEDTDEPEAHGDSELHIRERSLRLHEAVHQGRYGEWKGVLSLSGRSSSHIMPITVGWRWP